jgi:asparaginyl-tRNA synthetase
MKIAKIASVLQKNGVSIGDEVTVRGWIRSIRKAQKSETFLDISDGSSLKHLQVLVKGDVSKYNLLLKLR